MIILDTNVVSELMRVDAAPAVKAWFRQAASGELSTTAITVAEILRGIRRLPDGRRRYGLQDRFDEFLALGFHDRIFAFDRDAADSYASIIADRSKRGSPIGVFDAMIAAIALARRADIASRDVGGFEGCGIRVINPWE